MIEKQLYLDIKKQKLFESYKLKGKWTCKDDSSNIQVFEAQEDGGSIVLRFDGKLSETLSFKKGSKIVITDNLIEYSDQDFWK